MFLIFEEEIVMISTNQRASWDSIKMPSSELACEACKLACLRKEARKNLNCKTFFISNDKGLATWKPSDHVLVSWIRDDPVQLEGEECLILNIV